MYILLKVVWSGINGRDKYSTVIREINPSPIFLLRTVPNFRVNWTDDHKKVEDLKVIGVRVCC